MPALKRECNKMLWHGWDAGGQAVKAVLIIYRIRESGMLFVCLHKFNLYLILVFSFIRSHNTCVFLDANMW